MANADWMDAAMKGLGVVVALLIAAAVAAVAWSGHEMPVYPSYYPHEIKIETLTPDRAAGLLLDSKIQAYIGGQPRFTGPPPDSLHAVESLGTFVVVRINPDSPLAKDEASVCAVAHALARDASGKRGEFFFHPYPVTPWHGDYLYHADAADAARARLLGGEAGAATPATLALKVRAASDLAESLVRPDWRTQESRWDATIEEVDAADLIASATIAMNGWLGPPWVRTGWFQAALLLGEAVDDLAKHDRIEADLRRLKDRTYENSLERINLERDAVGLLAGNCHRAVLGYTVKREYFSAEYSAGIENVGFDSITGLNSPIFIRTAKLKDFPWNGWLTLGAAARPTAAWNPIAGFGDRFGQLTWSALSDPALLPSPNDAGWMLNRISDVQATPGP
jgi:hypothetical protein